ncbi:MAG TPA: hypothetical protein VGH84_06385 [Steroidobacteraceae bacterium]
MNSGVQANPQWVLADGKPYYFLDPKQSQRPHAVGSISEGNRQDYAREVGWQGRRRGLGPSGWIFCVPLNTSTSWKVTTADDSVEGTIASPPTVAKPPAGTK